MNNTNPALKAAQQASKEMFEAIASNTCFRVEAGAGAGKTYSLVESLRHLIEKKARDYEKRGQQIACITYTNVAANEIKERTDNHPIIFTDTIHAFSWSLLKGFQPALRALIPELSDKWATRIEEAGGIKFQKVIYDLGYPKADEKTIELHHDDVIKLMTKLLEKSKFQSVLKSRYPVLFIDEYQDTNVDFADSLVTNLIENPSDMLIGLFGDHWQKIYGPKACGLIANGRIQEIGKNANFRSDKNIVECLNRMRPELPQHEANPDSSGEIVVFHSNVYKGARRTQNHWQQDLPETDAHSYLERAIGNLKAQGWGFEVGNSKILMLTNNVLAAEQNYRNLTECFPDSDDYLKKNDHYIKFFLKTVEPLCEHFSKGHYGEMFSVLGNKHPRLTCKQDKVDWSTNLKRLIELRRTGSIREVLELLKKTSHPRLSAKVTSAEERFYRITEAEGNGEEIAEADQKFAKKIRKLESVSYTEVMNLYSYVEDKTPFSTKHGVKGAEFNEVLVVCGRGWNHYDWNQFLEWFGGTVPSQKQDAYERNRNLFYVSCSRAKKKLGLLFTQKLSETALQQVKYIFGKENVHGEPSGTEGHNE
ncbi:MAG: AAA family ATPase [Desulfobacteraceae bacterium]|nr:AAA family ATPase [Desulfobacteraceae bacterium]